MFTTSAKCGCSLYNRILNNYSRTSVLITNSRDYHSHKSIYGNVYDPVYEKVKHKPNKDPNKVEKMPIFDYGVNLQRKRLYVWGAALDGQLGIPSLMEPELHLKHGHLKSIKYHIHHPTRHTFGDLNYVRDIAVGHGFTLVSIQPKSQKGISRNTPLYGCGLNTFSQLGYHPNETKHQLEVLTDLTPISLPLKGQGKNCLSIASGRAHSLISVENEGVFTLGDNSQGQCGRFIVHDEEYFGSKFVHKLPKFNSNPDLDVIHISANYNVSYCLTRSRSVFSFGENDRGQLGRGKEVEHVWEPTELFGDIKGEPIAKIVTNGASTMALSDYGEVFVWGSNECCQLSPSHDEGILFYEPTFSPMPNHVGRVKDIAIGDQFSLVLNEEGNVFSWGQGRSLGLGPSNLRVRHPTIIPPPLFGRNEFNPANQVTKINSGFFFASAINSYGDLYVWGSDSLGCLGLGKHAYQSYPLKVAINGYVLKAIHGINHTVVLTKAL